MEINSTPQVVSIAGSDSGGGAGMQADLKSFENRHVFGMSILTAITAQNTIGVQSAFGLPLKLIDQQFDSLNADFKILAAKTGMLSDQERVIEVAENLKKVNFGPVTVDPVMVAKGGAVLLTHDSIDAVKNILLPLATIVTPNLPEAETLVNFKISTPAEMRQAAEQIQKLGVPNVIIKGGHGTGDTSSDYVLLTDEAFWMTTPRVKTHNSHGTGDTFSACITAELAKGISIREAIITGKSYVYGAIKNGIAVGHGHGPTNHWTPLEDDSITIVKA